MFLIKKKKTQNKKHQKQMKWKIRYFFSCPFSFSPRLKGSSIYKDF